MYQTARRGNIDPMVGQINRVMDQLNSRGFGGCSSSEGWSPPINLYRLGRYLELCLDLAGVEPQSVDVDVRAGAITVRGVRIAPQPAPPSGDPIHIVCMEIDHGPFCRTIELSDELDTSRVQVDYRDGILWIRVPQRDHG